MRVISTVHKEGFDQYGQWWLDGTELWPKGTEFILYTEGFDLADPRVKSIRVESLDRAEKFKAQYRHYKPAAWRWDIVRFGNKVFVAHDALYDYEGIGVWLDADAITFKKIPPGYVEKLLPKGHYMAMFKRFGFQTETGFWVMDCSNSNHKPFMDRWIAMLETGAFKRLPQWCDASTLDATVRAFEKDGLIKTASLSEGHEKQEHPMAHAGLAEYIDHLKGAERKLAGASIENRFRRAK